MSNKLYPQSSNELETLCSHTIDNELRSSGVVGERLKVLYLCKRFSFKVEKFINRRYNKL